MRRGPRCFALLLALAGCVNNYVLTDSNSGESTGSTGDQPTGDSCVDPQCTTTTTADDATASSMPASSSSSSSSSPSSSTSDDPSEAGDPGDGASATIGDPMVGICEPCEADLECGTGRLCVVVDGTARCLGACTEQEPPCADVFMCEAVESVDGEMADQCVPIGPKCPIGD